MNSEAGEKSTWTLSIAPPVLRRRSGPLNVSINGRVYLQATVTSFCALNVWIRELWLAVCCWV
jgi:hypothetical protein